MSFGYDWKWWLIPTTPVLNINYFEKVYTFKQIRNTFNSGKCCFMIKKMREFEEDEYDTDRKLLSLERR